jgi:FkbM family methyltransferase
LNTVLTKIKTLPVRCVAGYLRNFSVDVARWRLKFFAIREARRLGSLLGSPIVRTKPGFRMALDMRNWQDQHIYATGEWEDYTTHLCRLILRPGDAVIDVGANIGFFSLLFSKCVADAGRVIAFEPVPHNRRRLLQNLELNAAVNVGLREEAASDSPGSVKMNVGPASHNGISSFRTIASASEIIDVRTVRIDDTLDPNMPVRLVKIDVEGAEAKVIRGMSATLEKWRPDLIIEITDNFLKEMGDSAQAMCDGLISRGYSMYHIDWDGLVRIHTWRDGLPSQFDAFFTARPLPAEGLQVKQAASE